MSGERENTEDQTGTDLPSIVFPDIGTPDVAETPAVAAPTVAEQIQAAQEKQSAEFRAREERYMSTIDRLVAGVGQPAPAAAQQTQTPRKLPDPIARPAEFNAEITRLVDERADARQRSADASTQEASAVETITTEFFKRNHDLVGLDEIVDHAWQKEAKRIVAAGGDPKKSLVTDPGMPDRIATTARARATELGINLEARSNAAPAAAAKPAGQANRTAGVSAGSIPAGGGAKSDAAKPQSFMSQLRTMQSESGYY